MAWLADYTKRKKCTIDNTKVDAALSDFPVLVYLNADAQIGAVSNADGFDIRFTSSDGTTLLKYEREDFVIATNQATGNFWVKIPSVSSSANTEFYIYYRATDTADGADPTNVWDSNFKAVHHLKDNTASTVLDSTSNDNDGTKTADDNPAEATGQIGKAQNFGGDDDIDLGNDGTLNPTNITVEALVKYSGTSGRIVAQETSDYDTPYILFVDGGNISGFTSKSAGGNAYAYAKSNSAYNDNAWHYVALVITTAKLLVYVDGAEVKAADWTNNVKDSTELILIGASMYGGSPEFFFTGLIDETRISDSIRSAAWIKASYNSGNNSLLSLGSEETETPTATVGQNLQPLLGVG